VLETRQGRDRDAGSSLDRLDIFRYEHIMRGVARASAASDAFNAIGEPTRRAILEYLASAERSVGEVVDALDVPQPSVSKHLRVLNGAGLVDVRRDRRQVFIGRTPTALGPCTNGRACSSGIGAASSIA